MRVLAVGAMAFPTRQGTQALVREQCAALAARGHDVHLLCYAAGIDEPLPFRVHRIGDWPRLRSLRSGPLPQKPLLDVRLAGALRRLVSTLRPEVVLAHHVEGLAASTLPRVRAPLVYHAHTRLDLELPGYLPLPRPIGDTLGLAAASVELVLARRTDAVVAVAPDLAEWLGPGATYVPPVVAPWTPRPTATPRQGVLYQGNLDRYQGLDVLLDAWALVARTHASTLRVVTASEPGAFLDAAARRGLSGRVAVEPLRDLLGARAALGAAAAVVVPRRVPGGFPIKLLEALVAGRPVVVSRRAAYGLVDGVQARVVPDDDPTAFAGAIRDVLDDPEAADRLGAVGRAHALAHHGDAATDVLEGVLTAVARGA